MKSPRIRAPRPLSRHEQRVREWVLKHRGVATEVAAECGVTQQHVALVMYGQRASKGLRIERALEARGCPVSRTR